jgi:tetratricopeptide (TPR) repeat protein
MEYYFIEQGGNFARDRMQSIAESAAYFRQYLENGSLEVLSDQRPARREARPFRPRRSRLQIKDLRFTIDSIHDDGHEPQAMISTATRVQYATGYIALGLLDQAEAELAAIPSEDRELPDALAAQTELAMAARCWTDVVRFARRLTEVRPDDVQGWVWWAYALREMQQVRDARSVLLQIETTHGNEHAVVPYNLACYYSLLGEVDIATRYLSKACKMDPGFKDSAVTDPDLVALRADIVKP